MDFMICPSTEMDMARFLVQNIRLRNPVENLYPTILSYILRMPNSSLLTEIATLSFMGAFDLITVIYAKSPLYLYSPLSSYHRHQVSSKSDI